MEKTPPTPTQAAHLQRLREQCSIQLLANLANRATPHWLHNEYLVRTYTNEVVQVADALLQVLYPDPHKDLHL